MARKCGRCRQEGHTRTTCPNAGTEQVKCEQCGNEFSTTEGSGAVFCSKTCFEWNGDGKTGSPWKPVTRTCACGEISTMGPFPGRHEVTGCDYPNESDPFTTPTKAEDYNGEDVHPDEPTGDHRKWCTRCKLLGHYSADCTTAVLEGGVVSVPVSPGVGMVSVPVVALPPEEAGGECECGRSTSNDNEVCDTCAEPAPATHTGRPAQHSGQYLDDDPPLTGPLVAAAARVREGLSDPFTTPTQPVPEVNVSGQPAARYEWYGKQNRGYLVTLPETGDFRRYKNGKPKGLTRATTFNKAATDQNSLTDWAKRNVLIGASKRPDLVAQAHGLTHEDNRDQLMKLVAELETTAGAKISADIGTLIHELTERWDAGVLLHKDIPAAYKELVMLYTTTLREAGLRPVPGLIERTTYIPQFGGVVGTLDRVYYHEPSGQYVIGDVKTGKTLKYGMDEIETQEWIYAHGVNSAGVYDWNTDTWDDVMGKQCLTVSEEWGVVVHMPVQGPDAGKVMLVRADLQRGRRHAEVCHDVRVQRANKPKPEAWTGEELKAPEMPAETDWAVCFSLVQSKDDAAVWWQKAYDAGVPPEEMERLKEIADARLAELKELDQPLTWVEQAERVLTKEDAADVWQRASAAGVQGPELDSLVAIMQRELS